MGLHIVNPRRLGIFNPPPQQAGFGGYNSRDIKNRTYFKIACFPPCVYSCFTCIFCCV